jgi:radical SAM protein with 4Fe4S-binding SPASM domain
MSDQEFNPLEMAKTSKTFCIFPWVHQHVGTRGDVKPCCVYGYENQQQIGNLKENSLAEIWNNEETRNMRLQFLRGEKHPHCAICNNRHTIGDQFYNAYNDKFFKDNKTIQDVVANTRPDGSLAEHKLYYIDVRFNNLCNLRCRTCGPYYSTSWVGDNRKLYPSDKFKDTDNGFQFAGKTEVHALEEILPHLETAELIYFAGGEPLMQEDHYKLLDRLIELGRTDVSLQYNTNFSNFKLKGYDNVLEYWKKFTSVQINASLDGSHNKGEYWRKGTDWATIVENRKMLMQECPHVDFNIGFTLSWPNAHNLVEFHREWVKLGFIRPDNIMVNPLDTPPYYNLKNIPEWKKREIELLFLGQIEWLKKFQDQYPTISNTLHRYDNAIKFMYSELDRAPNMHESLKMFSRITKKLDEIREEDFFTIYPEHINMKNYLIHNKLDEEFDY